MRNKQGKPAQLSLAIKLLYLSLFLSLARTFLSNVTDNQMVLELGAEQLQTLSRYLVAVLLLVYIIFRISAGSNWARILYLALLIAGIVKALHDLSNNDDLDIWNFIDALQFMLQIYIIYLLFISPARTYFNNRRK